MSDVDFKNALLAGEPTPEGEETRTVPSHAGDIVVRALSRAEVLRLNGARDRSEIDVAEFEAQMVSLAMVTPKMSAAEVTTWQEKDKAGGVLGKVTDAISELSNLSQGADKSRVAGVRGSRKRS